MADPKRVRPADLLAPDPPGLLRCRELVTNAPEAEPGIEREALLAWESPGALLVHVSRERPKHEASGRMRAARRREGAAPAEEEGRVALREPAYRLTSDDLSLLLAQPPSLILVLSCGSGGFFAEPIAVGVTCFLGLVVMDARNAGMLMAVSADQRQGSFSGAREPGADEERVRRLSSLAGPDKAGAPGCSVISRSTSAATIVARASRKGCADVLLKRRARPGDAAPP